MIEIWTIQMSKWRKLTKTDIELIDITHKTGQRIFAPDSGFLHDYKNGVITEHTYTQLYLLKMRFGFNNHRDAWNAFKTKKKIALACYCKPDTFCHRHLFKDYLTKYLNHVGIEVIHKGEFL